MAKHQTRRSISLRGATYARLLDYAHAEGTSASEVVEQLLAPVLARREHAYQASVDRALRKVEPPPPRAPARPVPTEAEKQATVARKLDALTRAPSAGRVAGRPVKAGDRVVVRRGVVEVEPAPIVEEEALDDFEAPVDEWEAREPRRGPSEEELDETERPRRRNAPVIPPAAKPGVHPAPEGRDDPSRSGRGAEARVKVAKAAAGRAPRNVMEF